MDGKGILQNKLNEHIDNSRIWQRFYNEIEELEDLEIQQHAEDSLLAAWDNNQVIFIFDHFTLPPIDKLVMEKSGNLPNPKYKIFNYHLRMGKAKTLAYIQGEIDSSFRHINALTFLVNDMK